MNVPGVAWVGLLVIVVPTVQAWVAMQWPEASYPITFLIVGTLGGVAKWAQMTFMPAKIEPPQVLPTPDGVVSAPAPVEASKKPSRLKTWLIG